MNKKIMLFIFSIIAIAGAVIYFTDRDLFYVVQRIVVTGLFIVWAVIIAYAGVVMGREKKC